MHQKPGTSDLPKEVSLTIPILENMEMAATQTAEAVAQFMEFDREQIDEVKHALIEACINAFEHSKSEDDKVYIRFVMDPEKLVVVIQDFGQGFAPGTVVRPDMAAKVTGQDQYKRGWGLMLIESLMDTVDIASGDTGTQITMTKLRHKGGAQ